MSRLDVRLDLHASVGVRVAAGATASAAAAAAGAGVAAVMLGVAVARRSVEGGGQEVQAAKERLDVTVETDGDGGLLAVAKLIWV